jgi:uncharacterized protein
MKQISLNILLLALLLALSAFAPIGGSHALAQEGGAKPAAEDVMIDPASMVENSPVKIDAQNAEADPALWVVKDADTTIYLFGTVHVLKPGMAWFDDAVKTAFDSSDTLVLEIVQPEMAEMQTLFVGYGIDKTGKTLRSKLSEDDRKIYDNAMTKLGLPVTQFDPFKPWAAAVGLQGIALTKDGFDPNSGAETVLTSAAKQANKKIAALETAEYQFGVFDGLPEDMQIRFLMEGSADLDKNKEIMDDLVSKWASGDIDGLAGLMNEGLAEPLLFEKLLTQRNANWARWINKRMKQPGTVFIAVGAGHLGGSASVQHLISAYGLQAQRVEY